MCVCVHNGKLGRRTGEREEKSTTLARLIVCKLSLRFLLFLYGSHPKIKAKKKKKKQIFFCSIVRVFLLSPHYDDDDLVTNGSPLSLGPPNNSNTEEMDNIQLETIQKWADALTGSPMEFGLFYWHDRGQKC